MMYNLDTITSRNVQRALEDINAQANQLLENAKREVQRRGAAQQDYASIIPADIVTILTAGDKAEHEREEAHVAAQVKFSEVIKKCFAKLEQEEKRYQDRMGDLEGAMNPEAEITATQRYKQAKARLQGELRDQLRTRIENVDEQHSALEYAREFSELCAAEAKVVLTRSALLAGDYDAQLTGVYGDADSTGNQDSELIPLLRQLIAMLESGGPFYLSPELLNLLQQGQGDGSSHVTNINIHGQQRGAGQKGDKQKLQPLQPQRRQQQKVSSKLVKSSDQDGKDTSTSLSSDVVVIGDMSRVQTSSTMTEQEMSDKKKYLFEKQAYEAAKLENDLHADEVQTLEDIINDNENKKKDAMDDIANDFSEKLAKAKTEQEAEKIMVKYADEMSKLNAALEKQKQRQLSDAREKLLDRRRQKKKGLHHQHIAEAQREGVDADEVPDIRQQSRDDMMHDLKIKQQDLEQQTVELKTASIHPVEQVGLDEFDSVCSFLTVLSCMTACLRKEKVLEVLICYVWFCKYLFFLSI